MGVRAEIATLKEELSRQRDIIEALLKDEERWKVEFHISPNKKGNSDMIKSCVETDKQALLKLKAGFIDDWGILSSWKHEVDCCQWHGISCNNLTGHVTKLDVPRNDSAYLGGNIDSSLCDLQHLTHLNLTFTYFDGNKIPKCIGSLNQLRELILSDAGLCGTIPHELYNLSNLQSLDLGYNHDLIVNDLEWISNLSSLRHLDLSEVDLSNAITWQSSLSRKAHFHLRELILSEAELVGIIPHQLRNLSNLETLDLSGNYNLIANNLEWISHLPSLRHLYLSRVNLSRAIDWQLSLSKSSSLSELYLDGCSLPQQSLVNLDLSGNSLQDIPTGAFANMNSLKNLDLSETPLQHVAPDAFTYTTSLESLYLYYTNLHNDIGIAVSTLCRLRVLQLSANNLFVPLSDWMPQLYCAQYSIEILDIEDSFSRGPFPDFSKFSSLVSLYLTNTSLYGPIPQSLGHLPHLSLLDISQNNLSGPFPKFHEFSLLEGLYMPDNQLNGVVDEVQLSTLSSLKVLDVSHNFILFNISPKWVPPFQLQTFFATSCKFDNGFPMWLKYQRELRELDISNGQISDTIPQWIGLFPSLRY
ncbi:receptor-like protein EIX2 [Prosopis cineraria]|uniref:receptor-like protein EIX2 n=1 Tax=Prosopis cineraria TaxID=364024 RepID=UPI00240F790A|nr:receptor-like protein EIX2 [Prosopis cineraria]